SAAAPVVFVAKQEVARWPLFGLLARLQRTVFVDRARRQKTREVNAEIATRLTGGDPVVLFGEGTSSDGNRVLAFRSALIGLARARRGGGRHPRRGGAPALAAPHTAPAGPAALPTRAAAGRLVWAHDHGAAPGAGRAPRPDRCDGDLGRAGRVRPAIGPQAD